MAVVAGAIRCAIAPTLAMRTSTTSTRWAKNQALGIMSADRITIDPEVRGGRPCIHGLRLRVTDILDMLSGGSSRAEILADYRCLKDKGITAALDYAARLADHTVIAAAE